MTNLLLDYAILTVPFLLWILLDSWAIRWRESYWKIAGYNRELSQEYTICLIIVFASLATFLMFLTDKWYLMLPFVLRQQAGFEDLGYWLLGTTVFKKDWSFMTLEGTRKLFGIVYPRWWPWLDSMPFLRFVSGGAVSFWGLVRSITFAECFILVYLLWFNYLF